MAHDNGTLDDMYCILLSIVNSNYENKVTKSWVCTRLRSHFITEETKLKISTETK